MEVEFVEGLCALGVRAEEREVGVEGEAKKIIIN
jgi:hypothetical protein